MLQIPDIANSRIQCYIVKNTLLHTAFSAIFLVEFLNFQVPGSDFVLSIVTLSDYESSGLDTRQLGGEEHYHRLNLWDKSLYEKHLCADTETQVAVKSKFFFFRIFMYKNKARYNVRVRQRNIMSNFFNNMIYSQF